MKFNFLYIILLFIVTSTSYSQQNNIKPDNRLYQAFGEVYVNKLLNTEGVRIKYMNYCLDNSYRIIDNFPQDKIFQLPELFRIDKNTKAIITELITIEEIQNFNIYKYNFERNFNTKIYYKLGNTGRVLELFSEQEVIENYNLFNK